MISGARRGSLFVESGQKRRLASQFQFAKTWGRAPRAQAYGGQAVTAHEGKTSRGDPRDLRQRALAFPALDRHRHQLGRAVQFRHDNFVDKPQPLYMALTGA